jgi:acyl-CoA thioester hydrolase
MADLLFKHYTEVLIRYGDIDMLQHVNNAKYLTYMEQARIAYALDVMGWDGRWDKLDMIVASVKVDFRQPLYLGDKLRIYSRCSSIGSKSFTFEYLFKRVVEKAKGATEEIVAEGSSIMVAWDSKRNQSRSVSDDLRKRLLEYEPGLQGGASHI